jgi:5-oxopent-3-ene-1,2,5-tricarboxylate decarboxylase/2-hydroxyhepta-2,4-diene-1,7-dioate isomerase
MTATYIPLSGTAYGIALNDVVQQREMAVALQAPPYTTAPKAPVLYVKPRNCFSFGGAPVSVPGDVLELQIAATIGVVFARDLTGASPAAVRAAVGGACLALDVSEPNDGFYRPAIRQQCRDGFLPLGPLTALPQAFGDIVTTIDGEEVHRWSLDRLARGLEDSAAQISGFMTLQAGDLLLLGLAGDAPRARSGQYVSVQSHGLASLTTRLMPEVLA